MTIDSFADKDSLSCRVRTTEEIDGDAYGFRVGWIAWDSPFRSTDLRIEDRIIGVDGVRCERAASSQERELAIGQTRESEYWRRLGAIEGRPVELMVKRDRELLSIVGALAPERSWRQEGASLLSPTGPKRLERDGFDSPWGSWYEQNIVDVGWKILDASLRRHPPNTRVELEYHRRRAARVDFLVEKYPGPFADAVMADYLAIERYLLGTRYELKPSDLEWRTLGAKRAASIAESGRAARDAFRAEWSDRLMPAFPVPDPLSTELRAAAAGRIVELPTLGLDDWLMAAGKPWMLCEDRSGRYFIEAESPRMSLFFAALQRYKRSVEPLVPERYTILGRIRPDPKMFVRDKQPLSGLELEPIAVCAGEGVFVVLETAEGCVPMFAGESELVDVQLPLPADDADPGTVLAAFFHCLKLGEETEWRAFFAPWEASLNEGKPWFFALRPAEESMLSDEWIRARRLLDEKVFDIRPSRIGEDRILFDAVPQLGIPKVEQVDVEVDHVGFFDGEYRAFADAGVHRMWRLQRIDGGPWRLAENSRWGL